MLKSDVVKPRPGYTSSEQYHKNRKKREFRINFPTAKLTGWLTN